MTRTEMMRLRKYLNDKFETSKFEVTPSTTKDPDSAEILLAGEFLGVIYKDDEEGDISYAVQLSILEMDLPNASDASLI